MIRYHTCGQEIEVEFKWNGLRWYPVYYTKKGELTALCPRCGELMLLRDMRTENEENGEEEEDLTW